MTRRKLSLTLQPTLNTRRGRLSKRAKSARRRSSEKKISISAIGGSIMHTSPSMALWSLGSFLMRR